MRLGILQCDVVSPEWIGQFGDYPDMFQHLLKKADADLAFDVYNLARGQMPESLDSCDAWLFTGSKCGANDDEDWIRRASELVVALDEQRRPTIGTCFGHQLIARALGGRVERASSWGMGVHTTRLMEQRPWMQPAKDELSLLVSHQDQVVALPPRAAHLATHPFCRYDMYQIGDHILTFQGHPEFAKGYSRMLMETRRQRIGEQVYEQGMASLEQATDSDVAGAWISSFLRAGKAGQARDE